MWVRRDMQRTEGSGHCVNPQETVASFKDFWKMVPTPCLCWQLFNSHPDEKRLHASFSTHCPISLASARVWASYCETKQIIYPSWMPSSWSRPYNLLSLKGFKLREVQYGHCRSLDVIKFSRKKKSLHYCQVECVRLEFEKDCDVLWFLSHLH